MTYPKLEIVQADPLPFSNTQITLGLTVLTATAEIACRLLNRHEFGPLSQFKKHAWPLIKTRVDEFVTDIRETISLDTWLVADPAAVDEFLMAFDEDSGSPITPGTPVTLYLVSRQHDKIALDKKLTGHLFYKSYFYSDDPEDDYDLLFHVNPRNSTATDRVYFSPGEIINTLISPAGLILVVCLLP